MEEKQIPPFKKEDFLFTSKPYEWLEENSNNKFESLQLIERMNEVALSAQIKNFKALYKAYVSAKNGNVYGLSATNFTGQEFSLDCGDWTCDDYGVTTTDRYGVEGIACTHPIMPVQRLYNIDSGTEKLKIAYRKGTRWRSTIVDKKILASNSSIIQLADFGVAVNSENSRLLVRYLTDLEALNYDKIPELNSVGRLGWIMDYDFSPYVENLVFDGETSFKHFFESVKSYGNYEKWLEVADSIRHGNSIPARIMLAASFASVLVEPCGALPFFVHLWGNTEGGKTVALMVAASVWANPRIGEYIHSFNSTGVAQELSATFCNSLPLILDELQIVQEKKDFDKTIYQLTEGVGRQRGAKTGGLQKTGTWSNCILTSGEMPLSSTASGGGAVNRIIDIEYTGKMFDDPVYVAETVKKHYGYAGRKFVEYISNDEIMDEIRDKQKKYMRILQQSESTDKQSIAASVILTADYFATRCIFCDSRNLTVDDIKPYLATKTEVSQAKRAYEYLLDVVTMNDNHFIPTTNENSEIWGAVDTSYAYIIMSKFKSLLSDAGYNPTATLSWLHANNLIEAEPGRKTRQKKINKLNRRCVWLRLDNLTNEDEEFIPYHGKTPFDDETVSKYPKYP